MITIKEIANICGVSATTVSNILNGKSKASEKTRQRVMEVVEEKGYKPNYVAQGLRKQKTQTIAIIAEDIAQFTSPPMIESIMEYCEECGYRVFVKNLRLYARWKDSWFDQEKAYYSILEPVIQDVLSVRADGVIYLAGHARIIRCLNENFPIPAVMAYAFSESSKVPSVGIDDVRASYELTEYLLKMGHTKIGVIAGKVENIHTNQRLLGYQRALFDAGIPYNPDYVYYGKWKRQSGYEGAKKLSENGITAYFAISDQMAGGVYDYLEEKKLKVGTDISVIGFDDQELSEYFRPGLTTTRLPLKEIGHEAAKLLIEQIEREKTGEQLWSVPYVVKKPCSMVLRQSVACMNHCQ